MSTSTCYFVYLQIHVIRLQVHNMVSMERIVQLLKTELNAKANIVRPLFFLVFFNFKSLFFQCRNTYQFQCTRWINSQLIWQIPRRA